MNSTPGFAHASKLVGLGAPTMTAILYATALATIALNVAPAMELQYRQETGLSAGQIGSIYFFELAAMGLATFPAYWWIGRIDAKRVAQCAYAVFIAGNVLSSWHVASFALLALDRATSGVGAGTLMVLGITAGARASNQNRSYALISLGQLASGALILYMFPALMSEGRGLSGVFWLCAGLGVLGLLMTRPFSAITPPPRTRRALSQAELKTLLLAIAFALAFNIVVGGLWAFVGEYAASAGLPQARIAQVLTYSTAIGIGGVALAFAIGDRFSRRTLLLVGYLVIMLGLNILHFTHDLVGFMAGCCTLSFGWNFCVPYIFAAVAAHDATGRSISSMNLAFAFGLAAGPLLAGAIIEFLGLDALAPCALASLALGTALMMRFTRRSSVGQISPP